MGRPRRRTKKSGEGGKECVMCVVEGRPCHSGTLPGNCVTCGVTRSGLSPRPFGRFFSKDLKAHIQLSACAPEDVIFTSNEDVLVIITTADGLSKSHRLASQNESLPSNDRLKYQLDQIICLHYIPSIWCRTATTGFITSALLGRGYLSLLFPSSVTDNAETSLDDLCLFNLLLTSLEKSIFEVENGFNKAKVQNDERYWTELSAALAILSFGLLHAQEGLNNHTIMPSCGGEYLAGVLAERIKLALENFTLLVRHQNLSCDPGWIDILDGSLEDLRSKLTISSICVRATTQIDVMSMRYPSSRSDGSDSICATSTPLSSIGSATIKDPGTAKPVVAMVTGWLDTGPGSAVSPSMEMPASTASLWDQSSGSNSFDSGQPDMNCGKSKSSKSSTLPHGNSNNMLGSSTLPTIFTSPDSGLREYPSPQPIPNSYNTGLFSSGIEQYPSHVSLPQSLDWEEETSVWDSRDLSPYTQSASKLLQTNAGTTAVNYTLSSSSAPEVQSYSEITRDLYGSDDPYNFHAPDRGRDPVLAEMWFDQ